MARAHSNFFQGQMDRGLIYRHNHSRKTQEREEKEEHFDKILKGDKNLVQLLMHSHVISFVNFNHKTFFKLPE
jgi:hypothetical protein